ncbi:MAG: lysophospholipase [Burkholderiales bacterium]|nr:lysophospholipase [Burkholderiales bacterium]MDE2393833.1 lysophospholipase [Burkholderiales bacterium]MDE2454609.1 lysophospholipase [Burkholderiales bacterium]
MDSLRAGDGTDLHLRRWPASGAARGDVLLVHGLGEHSGRYGALAAALNAAGWHVTGFDQRGHGASAGARGVIPAPEALLADLALVIDAVRGPGPLVLLGHSMGGLVGARFAAEALAPAPAPWSRPLDGLVLSSPALDPGMNAAQKALLALLGRLAPNLAVNNGLKPEWISRDPAVVADYVADPLVHNRIAARLVRFIVDGGACARALAPRWRVPTLLLWAGADRCVAPAASAAFAAAAPPGVVTAQACPGLFHEIFNEPEKAGPLARLMGWLARFSDPTVPEETPR